MVSALVNGVKACPRAGRRPDPWGGKWFSLIDKVYRPSTLAAAWTKVERNKGAAGVDGQGIERFAAQAARHLTELHEQLKDGSYRPAPVKRVEIAKGDGKTRPLGIPTVKRRYGASDEVKTQSSLRRKPTECPMPQLNDLSRCLAVLDQDSTLIAVIEMSQSNWLVTGIVPGVERHPAKKLEAEEGALLGLLHRGRDEAGKAGRMITRIAVAPGLRRGRLLRRGVTASGWPAGCGRATSKPMSSTRSASRCRVNTAAPKPTGSIARS